MIRLISRALDWRFARQLRRDPLLRQWAQALRERGIKPERRLLRPTGGTCPTR